jgi:hypothetical protein
MMFSEEKPVTVLFDRCVSAVEQPDGFSLMLMGENGCSMEIDPREWGQGDELISEIRSRLNPQAIRESTELPLHRRIRELAQGIKHRKSLSSELECLPELLAEDEELITLANADTSWMMGLLAVTDTRTLRLVSKISEVKVEEFSHSSVEDVGRKDDDLYLAYEGERHTWEVRPRDRSELIVNTIREGMTSEKLRRITLGLPLSEEPSQEFYEVVIEETN